MGRKPLRPLCKLMAPFVETRVIGLSRIGQIRIREKYPLRTMDRVSRKVFGRVAQFCCSATWVARE